MQDTINNNKFYQSLDLFRNADNIDQIMSAYKEITDCINGDGLNLYHSLVKCARVHWCKEFKSKIDAKLNEVDPNLQTQYEQQSIVIVGAGPGGLVTALECALMGARVTVIEKRTYLSRNNILHLWPITMKYLHSLGAKIFHPKFGSGGMDHIGTKQIQRVLIKLNLLLGVKIHFGHSFEELYSIDGKVILTRCCPDIPDLPCTLLVGADGVSSTVAKKYDFNRSSFVGNLCIGMTFNFKNNHTKDEVALREFAVSQIYHQSYFKEIEDKFNITLENLVYYQGETHYFVMTIKKNSLFARNVFKEIKPDNSELLDPQNLLVDNLLAVARDTATFCGIPTSCEILTNHCNKPDVQLFDFSTRIQSEESIKNVPIVPQLRDEESPLPTPEVLVTLVGDALIEPFWPLGTGCNRAVLSGLDAAWIVQDIAIKRPVSEIQQTRQACYIKMKTALAETFMEPFKVCVNPYKRYNTRKL
jgi:hypothetical protein